MLDEENAGGGVRTATRGGEFIERTRQSVPGEVITARGFLSLFTPDPRAMLTVSETALTLSRVCRYGGRGIRVFSVAEHTLHCDNIARRLGVAIKTRRALFLHDFPEAIVGDLQSPIKALVPDFDQIEAVIGAATYAKYGVTISEESDLIVKHIDRLAHWRERASLFPFHAMERGAVFLPELASVPVPNMGARYAATLFVRRAKELGLEG